MLSCKYQCSIYRKYGEVDKQTLGARKSDKLWYTYAAETPLQVPIEWLRVHGRHQRFTQEPDEVKVSRPDLKTRGG
jgi:hypothetical protein